MKKIKYILLGLCIIAMIPVSAQQTLEGLYSGRNPAGDHLSVNFKSDQTVDFVENGIKLTTIDYEVYYNTAPNRVAVNYWANSTTIRAKAAIFEFVGQRLKFEYIDGDGTVFPAAFVSPYILGPGLTNNVNQIQDTQRSVAPGGRDDVSDKKEINKTEFQEVDKLR